MKKTAVLALALGAAATAHAQSGVSIYGIVDAGLVHESGGTSVLFTLENGHRLDTGEVDAPGTIFNRQAFVGIKGKAGMLTLGRQYTPWHQALAQVGDPFATGYAGGSKNVFPDFGSNVRTSNTVIYTTPVMNGLTADVAESPTCWAARPTCPS